MALGPKSQAHEPGDSKRPFLGVMLEEETGHSEGGARITGVIDGTAAEEAGLEEGDIIVRFDGRTIRDPAGLTQGVRDHEAGDRVEIVVLRDGSRRSFDVELGARKGQFAFALPEDLGERIRIQLEDLEHLGELEHHFDFDLEGCEGDDCHHYSFSFSGKPRLGVQLADTTPELRRHLGGDEGAGMLVTRVLPDTPAEEAGIRVGDMIVAVDGEAVDSASDIRRALRAKDGGIVEVELIRDGSPQRIDVSLPEIEEHEHSGPRSLRFAPRSGVAAEVSLAVREAMAGAREAMREATQAQREARREVARVQREAFSEARSAYREAMKAHREASREARRAMAYRAGSVL